MPTVEEVAEDLNKEADSEFSCGVTNNVTDIVLSVIAVICSAVASILIAGGTGRTKWVAAGFAAVPAVCTSIQRSVDFRGRSTAYFLAAARRRALARKLLYEGKSLAEVSLLISGLEIENEESWAKMIRNAPVPPNTTGSHPGT